MYSKYKRRPTTRKVVRRAHKRYVRKYKPRPSTKIIRNSVPDRLFVKLRYSEQLIFNMASTGVLVPYLFQSSTFDPDLTGVGHQPLWRDQYAAMYSNYRVWGIKYKTVWKQQSTQTLTMGYITNVPTSTTDTDPNTLAERTTTVVKIPIDTNKPAYAKGYMSVPKCYGLSKKEFVADDGFTAGVGSNPSKMGYLGFYCVTRAASATAVVFVELQYFVEFYNRVNIAGS